MKPKAPCKGCTERHRKCHSSCEKYIEYRKAVDEQSAALAREKKLDNDWWQTTVIRSQKWEKNHGRKTRKNQKGEM